MGLEITYKRVIQPRPFESVSLEVKRCFDDTDSDGFLKQDITKIFKEKATELEKLVDDELNRHANELYKSESQRDFDMAIDVGL